MNIVYYGLGVLGLVGLLFVIGQYVYVNYKIEKPTYRVIDKTKQYEIRVYDSYITASAVVQDGPEALNNGFRLVADFIFGNNTSRTDSVSEPVAMTTPVFDVINTSAPIEVTAPVIDEPREDGTRIVSFVMPREYTVDTLPVPNNKKIFITLVPEETWVVYTYSGLSSRERKIRKYQKLAQYLDRDGVEHTGEWKYAGYDPPSTLPFLRTHEIWIRLKEQ